VVVDLFIVDLAPHLEAGDIVIDVAKVAEV